MNTEKIVITLFSKDRPGIVQELSDAVLAHKGNWLESSLSRLCGQFTGIVHIEVAKESKNDLLSSLAALSSNGIHVSVQDYDGFEPDEGMVNGVQILVEANDRPGIVEEIASALSQANVNVEHMDTECESASMAGYPIFKAHLFLALPDDLSEEQMESVLEGVSDDLMVSVLVDD